MKFYLILIAALIVSCSSKPEPFLIGDVPAELESKLTHKEGHIPYYFPTLNEFGELKDGHYIGKLNGGFIDKGKVSVTIKEGKISDVEIIDITFWAPKVREEGRVKEFTEGLPNQVINKQTVQADDVSGATGSSHVFKICVTRALWQASIYDDPMDDFSPY